MIDLHCHLLAGVDDGPTTLEQATALAVASHSLGVTTAVATPHFSHEHRPSRDQVAEAARALRDELARMQCDLELLVGAEIAVDRLARLDVADLRSMTLGGGDCLLIESPFVDAPDHLEMIVNDLIVEGFTVLLAHPERSGYFHSKPDVLRKLIDRGALCSLTASAFSGRFGRSVQAKAFELAADGLAANISSDTHDLDSRPPGLMTGEATVPGLAPQDERDRLALSLLAVDREQG